LTLDLLTLDLLTLDLEFVLESLLGRLALLVGQVLSELFLTLRSQPNLLPPQLCLALLLLEPFLRGLRGCGLLFLPGLLFLVALLPLFARLLALAIVLPPSLAVGCLLLLALYFTLARLLFLVLGLGL